MLTACIAALAAREQDDLAREHANLADQLRERKEQRQNHLKRARSALVGNDNEEAVQAFSKAIELSVARTLGDALILAASDRWKPADAQRVELADMYTGRGLARLRMQSWADAVKDAHAAAFLAANRSDGGGHDALSLLGAASAGLCSLPQEPAAFFSESDDAGESKETPEAMTERLCHGLVADVYSMMVVLPGTILPAASAPVMRPSAMRSLSEPPGFCISSLASTRACFAAPGSARLSRTSGVSQMVSR